MFLTRLLLAAEQHLEAEVHDKIEKDTNMYAYMST